MSLPAHARLYGILDLGYVSADRASGLADRMLAGGIDILQLRAKESSETEILALGRQLSPRCRAARVPFILNDHPHLVPATGADGVHIGQDDGPIAAARALAGPQAIVGRSTHSLAQARAAWAEGADYIGFGPLFATPTKPEYAPIGTADIAAVFRESTVPVFCIGGIKRENLPGVVAAGAERVVVVSGILLAGDVAAYVADCKAALNG
ncbi:MAG: thiamine phosphate synthase [Terrimicrobiaceae bacterium]|nr:thiamine phosphate synthase [Terrimicrobiaceae bacterium]